MTRSVTKTPKSSLKDPIAPTPSIKETLYIPSRVLKEKPDDMSPITTVKEINPNDKRYFNTVLNKPKMIPGKTESQMNHRPVANVTAAFKRKLRKLQLDFELSLGTKQPTIVQQEQHKMAHDLLYSEYQSKLRTNSLREARSQHIEQRNESIAKNQITDRYLAKQKGAQKDRRVTRAVKASRANYFKSRLAGVKMPAMKVTNLAEARDVSRNVRSVNTEIKQITESAEEKSALTRDELMRIARRNARSEVADLLGDPDDDEDYKSDESSSWESADEEFDFVFSARTESGIADDVYVSDNFIKSGMIIDKLFEILNSDVCKRVTNNLPMLMNFGVLMYQLIHCEGIMLRLAAVYQYMSIVAPSVDARSFLKEYGFISEEKHARSESLSDDLASLANNWTSIISSEIIEKIRSFFIATMSMNLLGSNLEKKMRHLLGDVRPCGLLDIVPMLLNGLSAFVKLFEAAASGMSLHSLLMAESPVSQAIHDINDTLAYTNSLYTGLPIPNYMCATLYVGTLDDRVAVLKDLKKIMIKNTRQYTTVTNTILKAVVAANGVREQIMSRDRDAPACILVHGFPGIGKSKILPHILSLHSAVKGREFKMPQVFSVVPGSDYRDGYSPFSHPYWHFSELGNLSEAVAVNRGDTRLQEFCSIIDTLPFALNMAELSQKGKVFARPECVIGDCNEAGLHLEAQYSNPAAVRRRVLYINPTVMSDFQASGSCSIDHNKSLAYGGDLLDRYIYQIYTMVPVDNVKSEKKLLAICADRKSFDAFMINYFTEHIKKQKEFQGVLQSEMAAEILIPNATYNPFAHFFYNCLLPIFVIILMQILSGAFALFPNFLGKMLRYFFAYRLHVAWAQLYTYIGWVRDDVPWYMLNRRSAEWFEFREISRKAKQTICVVLELLPSLLMGFALGNVAGRIINASQAKAKSMFDKYEVFYEEPTETNAADASVKTSSIESLEELTECTVARVPLRNKLTENWNVREIIDNHPVTKNDFVDISRTIQRNIEPIRMLRGSTYATNNSLGVCNNYVITNKHFLGHPINGGWTIEYPLNGHTTSTEWGKLYLTPDLIVSVSDDLVMYQVVHRNYRDIREYFNTSKHVMGRRIGYVVKSDGMHKTHFTYRDNEVFCKGPHHDTFLMPKVIHYDYEGHAPGDCGNPLTIMVDGSLVISGVHAAGFSMNSGCMGTIVCKDDIKHGIDTLSKSSTLMTLSSESSAGMQLEDPHFKSPFIHENLTGIRYFGCTGEFVRMNSSSRLARSPFYAKVPDMLGPVTNSDGVDLFSPPVMTPCVRDGKYLNPYNLGLRNMSCPRDGLNTKLLTKCVDYIMDKISHLDIKVSPITIQAAINGIDGTPIKRINVRTSGGVGFPGKKSAYLPLKSPDSPERVPTQELQRKILDMLDSYLKDEATMCCFKAHLKDEARDTDKVREGKTRLFYATPLDFLIVCRMFLYPLLVQMMAMDDVFKSAVGIDMHMGSDEMMRKFLRFSNKFLEFDWRKFDQRIPVHIKLASFTLIMRLAIKCGYNDHALTVLRCILTQLMFPYINMNGDIFSSPIQPSGALGTAEINSIFQLIMFIYFWYSHTDADFYDNVEAAFYGDDGIGTVREMFEHFMNNVTFAAFAKEHYRMECTPARKEAELTPFVALSDVSFLKRNFRYSNELARWIAPLDYTSIIKSNAWILPSSFQSVEEQMLSITQSSLIELYFHHTEKEFNELRLKYAEVHSAVFGGNASIYLSEFPVYATLTEKFTVVL